MFRNKRQTNARFVDDALKTNAIKCQMFRLGCCLCPHNKISGYAPVPALHARSRNNSLMAEVSGQA